MIHQKLTIEALESRSLLSAASPGGAGADASGPLSPEFSQPIAAHEVSRVVPLMTTTNDPANYVADTGQVYEGILLDGVVRLDSFTVSGSLASICTGSLLPDGQHILTAAHYVVGFAFGSVKATIEYI